MSELNLFDKFQGSDLDRLINCLNEIKLAGINVDKYTQAGINPSSGNVYIWSDSWQGGVYCSIGFNLAWSYSCPECGKEYDFKSYEELCGYADTCNEHDHHCAACGDWVQS